MIKWTTRNLNKHTHGKPSKYSVDMMKVSRKTVGDKVGNCVNRVYRVG